MAIIKIGHYNQIPLNYIEHALSAVQELRKSRSKFKNIPLEELEFAWSWCKYVAPHALNDKEYKIIKNPISLYIEILLPKSNGRYIKCIRKAGDVTPLPIEFLQALYKECPDYKDAK